MKVEKINWDYSKDPAELADDYMCVQAAQFLINNAEALLNCIKDKIGFTALDSNGNEIPDEYWAVGSTSKSEGYLRSNLTLEPIEEDSEIMARVGGFGFDGKWFTELRPGDFNEEYSWTFYDDSYKANDEINRRLDEMYITDPVNMVKRLADIEEYVDYTSDNAIQLKYEGLTGIIRGCNKLIASITNTHNAGRRNSENEDVAKSSRRYFWVKNDWYGLICCQLVGENDKAYYFKYQVDDEVILPKWRVLKQGGRVKYETTELDYLEFVSYYPGARIRTKNGQVFSVHELKDLTNILSNIRESEYPYHVYVDYGDNNLYIETEKGVTEESTLPSFKAKGIKGWAISYDYGEDWDMAGSARVADYSGYRYQPSDDTPNTLWTITFED